ncbi:MAG: TIGR02147 family protein [Pseudomonadota bacterium]
MAKPNIFKYDNYRAYLKDWYDWMKQTNEAFSFRAFSRWGGLHSPNQLQLIIQGKRNITESTLPIFFKILKLKLREKKYFELLVKFNQANTSESKTRYLQEISLFFKKYNETLKHNQYEYLTKWYFPVLRELAATKDFKPDPQFLAKRIGNGLTPKQIKEAIKKLIELDLLKYDESGYLKQTSNIVSTGPESLEAAVYLYHEQMLEAAKDALHKQKPEERNFAGLTFSCGPEDVVEITALVNDFRKQVINYFENRTVKNNDDEVYQLGIQLFRLTKLKE